MVELIYLKKKKEEMKLKGMAIAHNGVGDIYIYLYISAIETKY